MESVKSFLVSVWDDVLKNSISYLVLSFALSGLIGFLTQVVAGRLLGPNGYRVYTVFFVSIVVVNQIFLFGPKKVLATRLSSVNEDKETDILAVFFILLLASVLFVLAGKDFMVSYLEGLSVYLLFLVGMPLFSLILLLEGFFQGFSFLKGVAIEKVALALFKLTFLVTLFFSLDDSILAGTLSFPLSFVVVLSMLLHIFIKSDFEFGFYSASMGGIKEGFLDSIHVNLTNVFVVIVLFFPPLIVNYIEPNGVRAGKFMAAFTLTKIPVYLYNSILIAVLPIAAKMESEDKMGGISKLSRKTGLLTLLFGILFLIIIYLFGPTIVTMVFGGEFGEGRLILTFTGSFIFIHLLSSLISEILIGIGETFKVLVCWAIGLPAFLPLIFYKDIPHLILSYNIFNFIALGCLLALYFVKVENLSRSRPS